MAIEFEQIPKQADLHTAFYLRTYNNRSHFTRRWQNIQYDFNRLKSTICAFLNTDGGRIYCGLDPRRVEVLGVPNPVTYSRDLNTLIKEFFDKSISPLIRASSKEINKTRIVIVDVKKIPKDFGYFAIDRNYFFRLDGHNIRADISNLDYVLKVVNYQFPYYYNAVLPFFALSEQRKIREEGGRIQSIGNFNSRYLYKYMDLESALLSLEKKNLRFVEPSQWDDQYEGRFYNAKYNDGKKNPISPDLVPFLYACCFTTKRENEAAWVLYPHNRTGLASRCVEFRLDRRVLISQIAEYVLKNRNEMNGKYPSLFFGKVQYESNSLIENVQNPIIESGNDNKNYKKYFDHFSLECYLNLLLLKRVAFEHEEEARVFIIPPDHNTKEKTKRMKNGKVAASKKNDPIYVDIQWEDIIEEVRIDKHCSDYEKSILQRKLDSLYEKRKKSLGKSFIEKDEKKKFTLIPFDPYEDISLKKGPLSIITN